MSAVIKNFAIPTKYTFSLRHNLTFQSFILEGKAFPWLARRKRCCSPPSHLRAQPLRTRNLFSKAANCGFRFSLKASNFSSTS